MVREVYDEGPALPKYNFLGHDDFSGLPNIAKFVDGMGDRRFFLSVLTVNSHSPYGRWRPDTQGGALGCERLEASDNLTARTPSRWGRRLQLHRRTMREAKASSLEEGLQRVGIPAGPEGAHRRAAEWLRELRRRREAAAAAQSKRSKRLTSRAFGFDRYERELRCADRFVEALYGILERAGRLRDTTLMITSDHGEVRGGEAEPSLRVIMRSSRRAEVIIR